MFLYSTLQPQILVVRSYWLSLPGLIPRPVLHASVQKQQRSHMIAIPSHVLVLCLVLCPDPTLPERKGLVTIRHPARPSDVAVWHVE